MPEVGNGRSVKRLKSAADARPHRRQMRRPVGVERRDECFENHDIREFRASRLEAQTERLAGLVQASPRTRGPGRSRRRCRRRPGTAASRGPP